MDLRHAFALPLPVVRRTVRSFLLFPGELLLLAAKPLLFVFKPTRIPNLLTCGKRDKAFNAQVYSDKFEVAIFSVDSREKMGFLCADEADVVLACGVEPALSQISDNVRRMQRKLEAGRRHLLIHH